jgi:hypothetical protein
MASGGASELVLDPCAPCERPLRDQRRRRYTRTLEMMATSWFADPELMLTATSASYVCNNLSRLGDALVRR